MSQRKVIHILGGGTFNHVRNHLSLAAPAFGETARTLNTMFTEAQTEYDVQLHLTKMADHTSNIVTNDDVEALVDRLVADASTRAIIFNVALCDMTGQIGDTPSGVRAPRLNSRTNAEDMKLTVANKIIGNIRKQRKDVFLVGFKTTCGDTVGTQYIKGLNLLKGASCNLVLANDIVTRHNMVIVPEEAHYHNTTNRTEVLQGLVDITIKRLDLHFTRSNVVDGSSVDWNGPEVPSALREVVNYCIERGAYKPFRGVTAGHFAYKVDNQTFITSKRKTNFNQLDEVGLVKVVSTGPDSVVAYGARPSVGGQSQRIIFSEHDDVDCIVHFHCPTRPRAAVSTRDQYPYECGSHECGKNTSDGLREDVPGVKSVYLDHHGPNIVFNRNIDPKLVISYIESHFDLEAKTGGAVA